MASIAKSAVLALVGAATMAEAFAPVALPLRPARTTAPSNFSPSMVSVTVNEASGDKQFQCERRVPSPGTPLPIRSASTSRVGIVAFQERDSVAAACLPLRARKVPPGALPPSHISAKCFGIAAMSTSPHRICAESVIFWDRLRLSPGWSTSGW